MNALSRSMFLKARTRRIAARMQTNPMISQGENQVSLVGCGIGDVMGYHAKKSAVRILAKSTMDPQSID